MVSSGMLRRVALVRIDDSEELSASLQEPHSITSQKTPSFNIKHCFSDCHESTQSKKCTYLCPLPLYQDKRVHCHVELARRQVCLSSSTSVSTASTLNIGVLQNINRQLRMLGKLFYLGYEILHDCHLLCMLTMRR
jgi:hypothetical protein